MTKTFCRLCGSYILSDNPNDAGEDMRQHRSACHATQGQRDYEADLARRPNYHDGAPRKRWDQLDHLARYSWERPSLSWSRED